MDEPTRSECRTLISDYKKLVPYIADAHWAGTEIAPYYLQLAAPPAFARPQHKLLRWPDNDHPELATGADSLEGAEKESALGALHRGLRWKKSTGSVGGRRRRRIALPALAVTRADVEGLGYLRYSLVVCRALWPSIVGADERGLPPQPFPLDISDEDAARVKEGYEESHGLREETWTWTS
ncbi:hypothetical protein BN946_scf184902.g16 [Trametes cinnabarina]|uniref:Uncharacterized protein n=1 Tax=Pycnoporus cinnabarinus TaxID=5643 RepID=A0A060SSG6_PYCCI|nr:hypothetical protein BN946_scf184902.g16 [Trametes cinnabarina]